MGCSGSSGRPSQTVTSQRSISVLDTTELVKSETCVQINGSDHSFQNKEVVEKGTICSINLQICFAARQLNNIL